MLIECTSALFEMEANPFPTVLERHLLEMKCFFKCQEAVVIVVELGLGTEKTHASSGTYVPFNQILPTSSPGERHLCVTIAE